MRGIIRQQLQSGMSEQAVIQYCQARYGDQIVWSPQWQGFSLLAWLVPIGLLLGGVILLFFVLRDWRSSTPVEGTTTVAVALTNRDQADLTRNRALLEQELADEDPLFARPSGGMDGS